MLAGAENTTRESGVARAHPAASLLAAVVRLATGVRVIWQGCAPSGATRVYFANHTSHLDALVLWGCLPAELRARTRPVAARDYWARGPLRRMLAGRVFRALLVDRNPVSGADKAAAARVTIEALAAALRAGESLIVFPEGTRGDGRELAPFKSGLYHLARGAEGVELVPAYLDNLNRILPKGEVLPVPVLGSVTFGAPLVLGAGEEKTAFLERARAAVAALRPA